MKKIDASLKKEYNHTYLIPIRYVLMPRKSDPPLKHKDRVFLLAVAVHINAKSKVLAQELDTNRHIYYAYSVVDSLNSSYSMFKYFFDAFIGGSPDHMHQVLLTPEAITGIIAETFFLMGFSLLATHFDKKDAEGYKKNLAKAWPYVRDIIKGLKNAFKGWRIVVITLRLFDLGDINFLTVPLGLFLGVVGAANRCLLRSLRDKRKKMADKNKDLFFILAELDSLTPEKLTAIFEKQGPIQYQTDKERYLGFFCSALGGIIEGPYLYMGVLSLSVFSSPVLILMTALCLAYTLAGVIVRFYEEYEFQLKLMVSQTKCRLVIHTKQIQTVHEQLLLLKEKINKTADDLGMIQILQKELGELIGRFEVDHQLLKRQRNYSLLSVILLGIKNSLYAYSATSSVLFLIGVILTLSNVAVPAIIILITVCSNLVFLTGFITHALFEHQKHAKDLAQCGEGAFQELKSLKKQLENGSNNVTLMTTNALNESLKNGLTIASAPAHSFQDWFEVFRSFFSGLNKGQKFVDFAGNPLQEMAEDGHYHDTPLMFIFAAFNALLFSLIFALRALIR